ncbi:hypothetical protein ES703_30250 [subsurface metagenome]
MATIARKPPAKPDNGAMPAAEITLARTAHTIVPLPEMAIPAPTNPATNPWVKLMGMP